MTTQQDSDYPSVGRLETLAKIVDSPLNHVAWLASLTAHPVIVEKLGGLGDRLARHCLFLVMNLQNEAKGIEVPVTDGTRPSTARAVKVHALGKVFKEYPLVANYVLDGVAALTTAAYEASNGELTPAAQRSLGADICYVGVRHGVVFPWANLAQRRDRFKQHLGEFQPLSQGPSIFWDVALSPEVLATFGVPAEPASVEAVIDLLQKHGQFADLFVPYIEEGWRRVELMTAE